MIVFRFLWFLGLVVCPFVLHSQSNFIKDTAKVNQWNSMGEQLAPSDIDKSLAYSDSASRLSKRINYSCGLGMSIMNKGLAWDYGGDSKKAIWLYDSAAIILKNCGDLKQYGRAISNKGVTYLLTGDYDKSVKNFLKSLKVLKEVGYTKGISSNLNNLGMISRKKGDYIKAIDYYLESINYKKTLNDEAGLLTTEANLSSLYYYLEDYEKALYYNDRSMKLSKKLEDRGHEAVNEMHRATIYFSMGRYDESLRTFKRVEPKLIEFKYFKELAVNYVSQGEAYLIQKELDSSEVYLLKAIEQLDQVNVVDYRLEVYRNLSELYRQKKDFEMSREYLDRYIVLKDKIAENSKSIEVKELESKYNYLAQKDKIAKLNQKNAVAKVRQDQQDFNMKIMWIAIGVLSLIVAFIIYLYRRVRVQREIASTALKDRELLLKEIHHRVKNNLQLVSSLLYLQSDYITDQEALEAIRVSRTRVESMAVIHQKLYSEDNLAGVKTSDYIANLIDSICETLDIDEDELIIEKEVEEISLDIDSTIPMGLILNELITNAVKHAFPEDQKERKIRVELNLDGDSMVLRVSDNGSGKEVLSSRSNGFGSRLIDMLGTKLDASKKIDNDNGYSVELRIKKFNLI